MKGGKKQDWPALYRARRNQMRRALGGGVVLWVGHIPQPRNYRDNPYPFRQNSHFLYYTGLDEPDLALLSYPDPDHDVLYWRPGSVSDVVWSGAARTGAEMALEAGIETVQEIGRLGVDLARARREHEIHYLPPYQASSLLRVAELLILEWTEVVAGASQPLMEAVAHQRLIKSAPEVVEIERALGVTDRMHRRAMAMARPGVTEHEIAGAIEGIALAADLPQAYLPIVTVRGEVLHNHHHRNRLQPGQLLLVDSGSESPRGYASDITRTTPVGGRFSSLQRDIYETVLRAQVHSIEQVAPGVSFREIHLGASRILSEGLASLGLMKGSMEDAVAAGAHALFFPHGLGHMLGLDVHDLEDLGDRAGYRKGETRSSQFGLNFLRMGRPLQEGFVFTVEPGIYFIPALIDQWSAQGRHREFIRYDRLESLRGFGGIRIEDDVLVTPDGYRVLGPGIPKTVDEVEQAAGGD